MNSGKKRELSCEELRDMTLRELEELLDCDGLIIDPEVAVRMTIALVQLKNTFFLSEHARQRDRDYYRLKGSYQGDGGRST